MTTSGTLRRQTANEIFVRRANKIFLTPPASSKPADPVYLISFVKNLESVGYAASQEIIDACAPLDLKQLAAVNSQVLESIKMSKGSRSPFRPFYPDFPSQVMEMSEARLRFNALLHYLTGGMFRPGDKKQVRPPLNQNFELANLTLGTTEEFEKIFTRVASANTSISVQDKEDIDWFIDEYGDDIERLMPQAMPHREVKAYVCAKLIEKTTTAKNKIYPFIDTATDVLRLAVALSGGDVSLAEACKFRQFKRAERKMLMTLLEKQKNIEEDMLRWKERWKRLGEKLHPGEFQKNCPNAAQSFKAIRNDLPIETFNSRIEKALREKNLEAVLAIVRPRPGDFARRLDHILRVAGTDSEPVLTAFSAVVSKVSTPVLLQVMQHFTTRKSPPAMRVFLPKGNVAKAQAIKNELPAMDSAICDKAIAICRQALLERFAKLPPLGKCFVDPELKNFCVPFSQRSASKSLRTAARGSKLKLPEDEDTIRFFLWWKNGRVRTDIDLSAVMFDRDFCYITLVSYYNLKDFGGCHSGDIVDAPIGASEFIDVSRHKCLEKGVRYILMSVNSYTEQPFCDLPECFAGWMSRSKPDSGEVYEPKTVKDKLDLSGNSKIAIPAIFDLEEAKVIWADMALTQWPYWYNNVASNLWGIQLTLKSMIELNKPNVYDLMMLHAEARGTLTENEKDAQTVFSVDAGTPFDLTKISAEFL